LVDFYDAKGVIENLLELIKIEGVKWVADTPEPYYHPGKSCSIMIGRDRIGSLGEIHPTALETFGLDKPVYCFELDFEKLLRHVLQQSAIIVPSRYPDSFRDMALLVSEETPSERIIECIKSINAEEVDRVDIFDVYRGTGIPEGFKSIAIRVRYRSYERTLLDDEISIIHSKILDSLVNNVKVSIR
jgi:phenylalanyl-tRNA synthetase beta chain